MNPQNREYLEFLRDEVDTELREHPAPEWDKLCEGCQTEARELLVLFSWAEELAHDEPYAIDLLKEPTPPVYPEYWKDRLWPPMGRTRRDELFDDVTRWMRVHDAKCPLHRP